MLTFAIYHTSEGLMELYPPRVFNPDVPLDVGAELFEEWNMNVQARSSRDPYTAAASHTCTSCGPGRLTHWPPADHTYLSGGELAAIEAATTRDLGVAWD